MYKHNIFWISQNLKQKYKSASLKDPSKLDECVANYASSLNIRFSYLLFVKLLKLAL